MPTVFLLWAHSSGNSTHAQSPRDEPGRLQLRKVLGGGLWQHQELCCSPSPRHRGAGVYLYMLVQQTDKPRRELRSLGLDRGGDGRNESIGVVGVLPPLQVAILSLRGSFREHAALSIPAPAMYRCAEIHDSSSLLAAAHAMSGVSVCALGVELSAQARLCDRGAVLHEEQQA